MAGLGREEPQIIGPLPGPRSAAWLERDHRVMSPSYTRAYPLVVRRARGAMVEDMDGNRFLDYTAGIAVTNAGHSHPRVVAAIRKQAGRLIHMSGTDFYYTPQVRLAERLAAIAPGPEPKRVFFTNSGAEAIEAALKLARRHTGRNRALAFMNAFHGRTYGAMSLCGSKPMQRRGFSPLVPEIHHARYGDLESVRAMLRTDLPAGGAGGDLRRADPGRGGLHRPARRISCRACAGSATSIGVLLVFDEVQSGIGRTGKMFASEHWGVAGDIVCLAKGIANGLPLGAIVARAVGDGLAQRQPRLDVRRQPGRLRRGAGDAPPDRGPVPRQRRSGGAASCATASRPWRTASRSSARSAGKGLMIGVEIQDPTARPTPACATGSSTWRSIAACSCSPAARARSGSARRCA